MTFSPSFIVNLSSFALDYSSPSISSNVTIDTKNIYLEFFSIDLNNNYYNFRRKRRDDLEIKVNFQPLYTHVLTRAKDLREPLIKQINFNCSTFNNLILLITFL